MVLECVLKFIGEVGVCLFCDFKLLRGGVINVLNIYFRKKKSF